MKYIMRSFDGTYYYVWSTTTEPKTGGMLPPWQDSGLILLKKFSTKKDADKEAKSILIADNPAVALGRKGGSVKSAAKAKTSAVNARLGGRPRTTLPDGTFSAICYNPQGASDGMTGTASEINAWLRGWSDAENLTVQVVDENDHGIAHKPLGRKTIIW